MRVLLALLVGCAAFAAVYAYSLRGAAVVGGATRTKGNRSTTGLPRREDIDPTRTLPYPRVPQAPYRGSNVTLFHADFVRDFKRVRRLLLRSGVERWSEADLGRAPQLLDLLIERRCAYFSEPGWEHKRLVFTHVPKTGGQSLQMALYKSAERKGMNPKDTLLTGHLRYGDVRLWKPAFADPPKHTDYVTVLRNPQRLVVSDYEYMRRNPKHPGHKAAQRFKSLEHYLSEEMDDGTGSQFALFTESPRKNMTLEALRAHCTRARHRSSGDPRLPKVCASGWRIFLLKAAVLLATRYNVVGVLERLEDSLEVARCRIPWSNLDKIPVHNQRPRSSDPSPTFPQKL
eukprot:Hpha_TRINITY_DN6328_c0_g2::TRINITY_DN6328_c0_g2_i1::g.145521::m.145521